MSLQEDQMRGEEPTLCVPNYSLRLTFNKELLQTRSGRRQEQQEGDCTICVGVVRSACK